MLKLEDKANVPENEPYRISAGLPRDKEMKIVMLQLEARPKCNNYVP